MKTRIKQYASSFTNRKMLLAVADACITIVAALLTNYLLSLFSLSVPTHSLITPIVVGTVCCFAFLFIFGAYSKLWRYFNPKDYISCIAGVFVGLLVTSLFAYVLGESIPLPFLFLHMAITMASVCVFRLLFRNAFIEMSKEEKREEAMKRTMIIGGGKLAVRADWAIPDSINLNWNRPSVPVMMTTDEDKLTQVFSNLISNALKHTIRGSITYGYKILNDTQEIEFYVSDTGSGIDPEFLGQIFNTYASKDAEQKKGYGLGLALCKIIVEKMGGTISVQSRVNAGTSFTIRMPFHGTVGGVSTSNRTTTQSQMVRTLRVGNRPDEHQMKTVLVCEDEESNYELVRIVLQKRYNLLHAMNGIDAVTMNEEYHPDLILMDIRMPEMNGLDATRIIKEVNHSTPVIALSAYAFEENIREAKAAGCDEFLAKPFRVEDLIETIAKYIGE